MNAIERVIERWRKSVASGNAPIGVPQNDHEVVQMVRTADADELERLNREVIEPGFEEQLFAARLDECKAAQLAWNASRDYCGDYFKDRIAELERNLKELGE